MAVETVRVRLAPSPTGFLHFGTARTAIFNWLHARRYKGKFIVRIEDTDKERSKKNFETDLLEGLHWLGIDWDEGPDWERADGTREATRGSFGPYRQSERTAIYENYLKRLLDEKKAYYCYCTKEELEEERQTMQAEGLPPKYNGHCRDLRIPPSGKEPHVIRFKMPGAVVEFKDMIRGSISFDMNLVGDIVIAKNLREPLYNFAVAVDDELMEITHVIRGEDHLSNTPKQIMFQRALEFSETTYAHLPLILAPSRAKLSKRLMETSLLAYRQKGYLPEAIVNFLALLGWHPKDDREIFSPGELIKEFDIRRVQKAGAIFNEEKLEWLNAQHLHRLSDEELARRLEELSTGESFSRDPELLKKALRLEKDRMTTLVSFNELAGFLFKLPVYDPKLLVWRESTNDSTGVALRKIYATVSKLDEGSFKRIEIEKELKPLTESEGKGPILWPLRVAVSGLQSSPDPLDIMEVLGKKEVLRRLEIALDKAEQL